VFVGLASAIKLYGDQVVDDVAVVIGDAIGAIHPCFHLAGDMTHRLSVAGRAHLFGREL